MNYNFQFSIITSLYNSEKYLKKCINSILNQTLDFESHIQIILIDDGSTDKTKDIALEYANQYPKNIIFLTQEHKGVSFARNYGLEYATGKYIHFLDSDDYISESTLHNIIEIFEANYDEIDLITLPIKHFERNGENIYTNKKEGIIDLIKNPNNPILSIPSTFIKHQSISNLKFKTDLIYSEDSFLLNQILLNKQKYYSISNLYYHKRRRFDLSNKYDRIINKKDYYTERIKNFHLALINHCLNNRKEIPKFIQYTLLYDLLNIIKKPELRIFDEENEKAEFFKYLKEFLDKIEDEIITENIFIDEILKSFLIYLKKGKKSYEIDGSNVLIKIDDYTADNLNIHKIHYDTVDLDKNYLFINGSFNSLFENELISVEAVKEKNGKTEIIKGSCVKNSKENKKFMSIPWQYCHAFDIRIPIKDLIDSKVCVKVNYHKDKNNKNNKEDNLISTELCGDFTNKCQLSDEKYTLIKNNLKLKFDNPSFYITKGYKFSVVMAIYNTEEYVEEAIQSVINQNIGFEDNIQLILVDDGSTDDTPNILSKYQKEYPNNIFTLTQENQGQATARNNGLKYIKGKYVNFLDSDDYLSNDAMKTAYSFLEKNYEKIDFVSIRQQHFGRKNTNHMLNYRFEEGDRIIDLINEPNNPQLASNAVFFKDYLFKKYKFPTNVVSSEDAILVNKILMNKKKYGVLEKPIYYYRKREDLTSTIDIVETKKEYFTEKLKNYYLELINYSLEKEGKVLDFIQYLCAYDLQWMLNQPSLDALETNEEKEEFWMYLKEVLKHLDYQTIAYNPTVNTRILKIFFIYLKNNDLHVEIDKYNVSLKSNNYRFDELVNHDFWTGIEIIEIKNNILTISGYFNSYFDRKNISIVAVKFNKNKTIEYFTGKYVEYTSRPDRYFLDKPWKFNYNFDIGINLKENEESIISLKVYYHKDGDVENYNKENIFSTPLHINFLKHGNISETSNYQIQDNKLIFFNETTSKFHIHKYSYKSMIKHEYSVIKKILLDDSKFILSSILLRLIHLIAYPFMKNKKIYIFSDRGTEADDNAMYLFKYAVSIDDNIKKYMVLSKENKQYKELSKIGKMIDYKSFKHKLIYLFSEKIISTHPYETIINPFFRFGKNNKLHFSGLNNPKIYFLQHGVTKDNISSWFSKFDKNVSLINTVSDQEKESFYEKGYGFDEEIIQTLGFPRFDNLLNNPKHEKEILIIPTWRKNLRGNKHNFINSDYYNSLNNLLNNKELINLMDKECYKIIFKPHPELNKKINKESDERYIDLFNINKKIIISENESYAELFKKASLMITDYSSVFFDFAYIKKPIIYYHPHDDYHYEKSYFDYETMGFGDVITEENELINKINEYILNNCVMEKKYKENVDKFFKYNDNKNCERVYEWIKNN